MSPYPVDDDPPSPADDQFARAGHTPLSPKFGLFDKLTHLTLEFVALPNRRQRPVLCDVFDLCVAIGDRPRQPDKLQSPPATRLANAARCSAQRVRA